MAKCKALMGSSVKGLNKNSPKADNLTYSVYALCYSLKNNLNDLMTKSSIDSVGLV